MRLQLVDVVRQHGSHVVLDGVSLQVNPGTRLGLVGAQRLRQVDAAPDPRRPRAAGQRHDRPRAGDADRRLSAAGARVPAGRVGRSAASRAGPASRRRTLELAAQPRSSPPGAMRASATRRARPLSRARRRRPRDARGHGARRARAAGRARPAGRAALGRRGGAGSRWRRSCSRATTCSCSTSRRTTSTSTGSSASSGSSRRRESALVVVSHDRAFLDRTVTRIAEIEDGRGRVREFAGGWTEYAAARDAARSGAVRAVRGGAGAPPGARVAAQRAPQTRRAPAAAMADRRGTHALMTKVRQAERLLDRNELPEKPFEPWQLQLGLKAGTRSGSTRGAARRRRRAARRLHARPDRPRSRAGRAARRDRPQRQRQVDAARRCCSASFRSTQGARDIGRTTVIGTIGQERVEHGETPLLDAFVATTGLAAVDARTLLAKFGLGADHVGRPGRRCRRASGRGRTWPSCRRAR